MTREHSQGPAGLPQRPTQRVSRGGCHSRLSKNNTRPRGESSSPDLARNTPEPRLPASPLGTRHLSPDHVPAWAPPELRPYPGQQSALRLRPQTPGGSFRCPATCLICLRSPLQSQLIFFTYRDRELFSFRFVSCFSLNHSAAKPLFPGSSLSCWSPAIQLGSRRNRLLRANWEPSFFIYHRNWNHLFLVFPRWRARLPGGPGARVSLHITSCLDSLPKVSPTFLPSSQRPPSHLTHHPGERGLGTESRLRRPSLRGTSQ